VAALVSATAVLNTVSHWLSTPISTWLDSWIGAYQAVFHPLIEATLGRAVDFMGYKLTGWGKDTIVIYASFGAALVRVGERLGPVSIGDRIVMWILWPFFIADSLSNVIGGHDEKAKENPEQYISMKMHSGADEFMDDRGMLRAFTVEFCAIGVIVVSAVLLNSSGVLK
jgi:hypothetical protein